MTAAPVAPTSGRPAAGRQGLPHVEALDGLRGLAIGAVLLFHAGHLTGGWLGVDLFFVLSGYLITALLLEGRRREGRVDLRRFWARRVRRLGPALVLTLVGVGCYAALEATATERMAIRWDGLATLFEVANWRMIVTGDDYWAQTFLRSSPLRHTWSLAIEEQLYLLWPLAVAAVAHRFRRGAAVAPLAAGGVVLSAAVLWGLRATGADHMRLYAGTDTRAGAVFAGAAVAGLRVWLGRDRWARSRPLRQGLGLVAAAGLAWAWVFLDGDAPLSDGRSPLIFLPLLWLGGAAVVASISDRRHPGLLGQVLAVPPLGWLGRISYGLYLYHWPLFLVLDAERTGCSGWTLTAVRLAASLAVAALSFRLVEQPIRHGRWPRGQMARAAVPAGAALAAIAILAGTLGAESRAVAEQRAVIRSSVPGAPLVMVAGDSVPLLMGVTLAQQADELGVSVANRSMPGCHLLAADGPIRGVEGEIRTDVNDCAATARYDDVVRSLRPDLTLLLFGEFPNEAVRIGGEFLVPCQPEYLAALRHRYELLLDDLTVEDTPVVLVTAPGTSITWILERVPPGMDERVACSNQLLVDLAAERPLVSVVDLASFVCPPGQACKEIVDGADLRPDGLHFEGAGAAYINRWLLPRVLEAAAAGD